MTAGMPTLFGLAIIVIDACLNQRSALASQISCLNRLACSWVGLMCFLKLWSPFARLVPYIKTCHCPDSRCHASMQVGMVAYCRLLACKCRAPRLPMPHSATALDALAKRAHKRARSPSPCALHQRCSASSRGCSTLVLRQSAVADQTADSSQQRPDVSASGAQQHAARADPPPSDQILEPWQHNSKLRQQLDRNTLQDLMDLPDLIDWLSSAEALDTEPQPSKLPAVSSTLPCGLSSILDITRDIDSLMNMLP